MQTRQLGNSDLQITRVGYGAWAIGGPGWQFAWGDQDDNHSVAAIHRALELGVNWIDTAAAYGLGHSEEIVAKALKAWSGPKPYVFTEMRSPLGRAKATFIKNLKASSVSEEVENSLRRLEAETIDLYQIHWPPDPDSPELEEGWGTLAELQRQGKLRWIGVSNFNANQIQRAQKVAPVISSQPPYSLVNRAADAEVMPYCKQQNIGVIVYSPMASGLLTGAMTRERAANLGGGDWRSRSANFNEPKLSQNLALAEELRAIGKRHGRSPGEVAIAWTLLNPAVTGAIVGARSAKQAEGVMKAGELQLTAQDISEIEASLSKVAA